MVNITNFTTRIDPLNDHYYEFDPTKENRPIVDLRYKPANAINSPSELVKWGLPTHGGNYSKSRGIGMKLF